MRMANAAAIVDQYYIADDQHNMLTDENVAWSYYTRSERMPIHKSKSCLRRQRAASISFGIWQHPAGISETFRTH